ncbi:MAG: NADH-quinone oxidoreductase subunit NuoG [Chloroflexi bacterium]|nr:NADH-quinone oxidoreductase subunit NuoG [Chloroflexota bacterium]
MADNVTLTIDGKQLSVAPGMLLVDAAQTVNIEIPVFCSHPKLDPVGCCRMCMVEIEGPRGSRLATACTTPVAEGMVVHTKSKQVQEVQEANLAFLLLNHPLDCPICDKGGECPLQDQTLRFGPGISQLVEPKRLAKKNYDISDLIVLDQERCVLCWRCIRYLEEWEDKPQLGLHERGSQTVIDIQDGQPVDARTSGNIIDICPVGALTNRISRFAYRPWEVERTPSVCAHCSIGCNIRVDTRTHTIRRIVGRENMQVNDQWICDKGRFAHHWVNGERRLETPLLRKNGELVPVQWSEALDFVAGRLSGVKQQHGASAIGAIGSAKIGNESNYLLQRLFRSVIGANNIDHRDGADVAALSTGLPALADLMKPQYGPNPKVDTIFLFGIDPSEELPILDLHLKRAVKKGGARLIIAHPRKIELTRYNGPYLAYEPGSEATLLNGLLRAAAAQKEGLNSGALSHLADIKKWTAEADDQALRDLCRTDPAAVKAAAALLAKSEKALIIYGPQAARGSDGPSIRDGLANLAFLTGHADRLAFVGLEANSQGTRDMGLLPDRLPGHAALNNSDAVKRLEHLWECKLPSAAGKSYKQMLDGGVKALYVMGADPASERPDWAEKLAGLELLVVQELYLTETAKRADVVLPALGWAESDATFTNLERRVQRAPAAVTPPQSRAAADWMILTHLARKLGAHWHFADAKAVGAEIAKAVPIYRGLTWDALGDQGAQWDASALRGKPELKEVRQKVAKGSKEYPLTLVTGTVLFDGGTLFGATEKLEGVTVAPVVALSPADASRLGLAEGAPVSVRSPEGSLALTVHVSEQIQPGSAWIPESLPGAPVGALLNGSVVQRVKVEKA